MNINNNFVGSRMNKSLDERLIGPGDYIDALNIRISSDEDGEAGSVENSKGNIELARLRYLGEDLPAFSTKCIGVFEDGTNETIYWFVTSETVDIIASYNVRTNNLIYHIVSTNTLNFSSDYPINSINLVDDLLFFTDNYNAPRKINIRRGYPEAAANGFDFLTEDDISVIVKPPIEAPALVMQRSVTQENFLEDKFIRFAYRYEYADGEYSALSEFSDLAFSPGQFELDYSDYDMIGMRNRFNNVDVNFNTGSSHVKGIDVCFKQSNSNVVAVVQKFNKLEEGWGDGLTRSVNFSNKKIYTTLTESELLRMFDNVPRKAKEQTVMGNRLMYGNYVDGYNIDTNVNYNLELISKVNDENILPATDSTASFTYSTTVTVDFTDAELTEGKILYIDLNCIHDQFAGSPSYPTSVENDVQFAWSFRLPQSYNSVSELATSAEFLAAVQLTDTFATADQGFSMTDSFFTTIVAASGPPIWDKVSLVRYDVFAGNFYDSSITILQTGETITFQMPGVKYSDRTSPTTLAYEFFSATGTDASFADIEKSTSWHSNRDYEVAIEYLDEYERASTALVSTENTVFVSSEFMTNQNIIRVSIDSLAPSWASRYRFVVKPSAGDYETIYSNFYYQDTLDGGAWWIRLEGDNQTKAAIGDTLIVKADSTGPTLQLITTKVLDIAAQEREFLDSAESAGLYMKVRANNFAVSNSTEAAVLDLNAHGTFGAKSKTWGTALSTSEVVPGTGGSGQPAAQYREIAVPTGAKVKISFRLSNAGSYAYNWAFDQTFSSQNSYDSIYDFIQGENINFDEPYINTASEFDVDSQRVTWDSAIGDPANLYTTYYYSGVPAGNILNTPLYNGWTDRTYYTSPERVGEMQYFREVTAVSGTLSWLWLSVMSYGSGRRQATVEWDIEIIQPGALLVFETVPEEVSDDIYYQSSKSYEIQSVANSTLGNYSANVTSNEPAPQTIQWSIPSGSGSTSAATNTFTIGPGGTFTFAAIIGSVRFITQPLSMDNVIISYTPTTYTGNVPVKGHYGPVQNQSVTQPAIIDLDMYNCFAFGNGVESFKINDAYSTPGFRIGARVTSVAEEDYKEANRYADITYSGVYNANTNLNKLNEFNLGLANYKSLEQSFGPINKLHGRQTDILVLQEDKISYVLGGKNLLSDAAAGGAIVSTPMVLGTQMSRVDEIGISYDTESFATDGPNTFFTDSKRGIVVNLTGGNASEALNIISSLGMRSWFRDEFIDDINKIKLGAYDSYMDEYVLTFTDTARPEEVSTLGCGVQISQVAATLGQDINYEIEFEDVIGVCDISYEFFYGSSEVLTENVVPGGVSQFTAIIGSVSLLTSPQNPSNVVISHTSAGTTVSGEDVGFYTVAVQLVEPNTQIVQYAAVYAGSAQLSVVYGGTEVINQTINTTGTITFSKNLNAINSAFVTIIPIPQQVPSGITIPVTYDLTFGCVNTASLTVISMRVNGSNTNGGLTRTSYNWVNGPQQGSDVSETITLGEGPVSSYMSELGISGRDSFPSDGSTVTMKHTWQQGDLPWDYLTYNFKYLASNILYAEADIATLLPLMTNASTVTTGNSSVGTFTYTKGSNEYLYLVWDYN